MTIQTFKNKHIKISLLSFCYLDNPMYEMY